MAKTRSLSPGSGQPRSMRPMPLSWGIPEEGPTEHFQVSHRRRSNSLGALPGLQQQLNMPRQFSAPLSANPSGQPRGLPAAPGPPDLQMPRQFSDPPLSANPSRQPRRLPAAPDPPDLQMT